MTLPNITGRQFQILELLYKYRYLNRVQIQTLLSHKNHRRINAWLKDLVEKEYIGRIYSKKLLENTKPAIYYLGKNGRKKLNELNCDKTQLQNTYRDKQRTEVYRQQRMYLAECYLSLKKFVEKNNGSLNNFITVADDQYREDENLKKFAPDAWALIYDEKTHEEKELMIFLLHERTPKYFLRYRLKHIVNYIDSDEYDYQYEGKPSILIISTKTRIKTYARKILETKLYRDARESVIENLKIYLTTLHEFINEGIYGPIWDKPEVKELDWGWPSV